MYAETMKVFDELEVHVDPKMVMSRMPVSQRQMVEIAKALSFHSKLIIMDEPTSAITDRGGRAALQDYPQAESAE